MQADFLLDMETSDPDDFLTLLLLLGHPAVNLRAVTVTPGSRAQIGLVRAVLGWFGREDIRVGSYNLAHPKECVSLWHALAWPELVPAIAAGAEAEEGWRVLAEAFRPGTVLVTGAPLKNMGRLLAQVGPEWRGGRMVAQGGFAGEGVVPPEQQLAKFRGLRTCPSFNLNGDPKAVLSLLDQRERLEDLRFVSKNVCHGVIYDDAMHARLTRRLGLPAASPAHAQALDRMHRSMSHYLRKNPGGKAFHDPLAACCAIDPEIGAWAEVEVFREKGEWGARLSPGSGVRIITAHDHDRFLQTLFS